MTTDPVNESETAMNDESTSLMEPTEALHTFTEWWDGGVGMTWKISRMIESVRTEFQQIDIMETIDHGKLLVHDGAVMLTERYEAQYHEALVHSAMLLHPNPRRVLVIGGGDGGTLREVLRHPEVELARQVEIDGEVVRIAKEHLPTMAVAYDDPRTDLIIGDGLKHVEDAAPGSYDVVLVDSTDPVGPAVPLFEEPFFRGIHRALTDDGILASQIADFTFHHDHLSAVLPRLRTVFKQAAVYQRMVQMYPSGVWTFGLCSKGTDLLTGLDAARAERVEKTSQHWTRELHAAGFALPNWLHKELNG